MRHLPLVVMVHGEHYAIMIALVTARKLAIASWNVDRVSGTS